jgi:cell wall-associated NlpC family hydrolase
VKGVLVAAAAVVIATPVAFAALAVGPTSAGGQPSALALQQIPADLVPVYETAALTCPGLPWQVLAGIGWVESRHGEGRVDPTTGEVNPPIVGPAIDGGPGLARIPDPTQPDGWAHALGPMQFLSTTWATWGKIAPDRPPGTRPDIENAWDAIYSAAAKLCGGQPTLTDLHAAILGYNNSEAYYEQVMTTAASYGLGSPGTTGTALAAGSGEAAVAAAMTQLGVPYVWGGESPGRAFDCSGLVQWAYAQIGVSLPRTTFAQAQVGVSVSINDLQPGDLLLSRGMDNGVMVDDGHIAIYAGGGMEVVARYTGTVVSLVPVQPALVEVARRVVQA